jgi:hypothetical protein
MTPFTTSYKGATGRQGRRHASLTYHTIPHVILMSSSTHNIPRPTPDRCDITGVPLVLHLWYTCGACVSIEKVGPCHQQYQSRARVTDLPTTSRASGS